MVRATKPDYLEVLNTRRQSLMAASTAQCNDLQSVDDETSGGEAFLCSVLDSEFREMRALDHAIERFHGGSYGRCEDCGRQIAAARLRALPHATLCIDCQRRTEV